MVIDQIGHDVTLFTSEISDRFTILSKESLHDLGDREYIYVIQHEPISGVNENISLVNSPSDFLTQDLSLRFASKEPRSNYINLEDLVITYEDGKISERFGVYSMIPFDVDTDEWNGTLYVTPQTHENIRLTVLLFGADDNSGLSADTEPFVVVGDRIGSFSEFRPSPAVYLSPDGGKMWFGGAPIYTNAFLLNNWYSGSNIATSIGFNFLGALNDSRHGYIFSSRYEIYNAQNDLVGVEQQVNNEGALPKEFSLYPNYPNPFNPSTVIAFDLPRSEQTTLKIYNILGQEVRTLVYLQMKAGKHRITWDGKNSKGLVLASGVYIFRVRAGDFIATRKMLFIR